MTWDEFREAHNFRRAEKCCASCKHGSIEYEGECRCLHPLLGEECGAYLTGGTMSDVCDLWERQGGAK